MFFLLLGFLITISVYHVLHTVFAFGIEWIHPTVFSVAKDVLWLFIVVVFVWKYPAGWRHFFATWKKLVLVFCLLIIWSLALSRGQDMSLGSIVVGFKYDIYPLFVLLTAIGIGAASFDQGGGESKQSLVVSYSLVMQCLLCILGGGLLWQLGKMMFPDVFLALGYGPVGDYSLGVAPPLYYRTGPGGMMRLQGLFSGPNNYGFFLVGIAAIVMDMVWKMRKKRYARLLGMVFALSLFRTLSRGAWLATFVIVALYIVFSCDTVVLKKYRRRYWGWCVVIVSFLLGGILRFSSIKAGSTSLHRLALLEGLQAFGAHPRGYGLGMAGPSVHYEGVYLPENQYLQILLDIGIIGFVLWGRVWYAVLEPAVVIVIKGANEQMSKGGNIILLLLLGIVGLMVEGLFLHVREDSMVNYLILVPFGFLVGYYAQK